MTDIGFLLKKFISFFFEPLGFVISLFIVAIYYFYMKNETKAEKFFLSSLFFLLLFSYTPFANFLISGLEDQYPKFDYTKQVEYIHVLGSGHNGDKAQPLSSQISDAGVKRVVEGVVIYKKMQNAKIIFTGYKGKTNRSNAAMNADLAMDLGVKKADLILNGTARDTEDEARFAKTVVGDAPFVLVTSATHMPRAVKIFEKYGMHPIAAPTNFYQDNSCSYFCAPNVRALLYSSLAIHEYLGMIWIDIKSLFERWSLL